MRRPCRLRVGTAKFPALPDRGADRTVWSVGSRNFTVTVEETIRALTIGPPAWAVRKRKIEDATERFVADLVELHDALAAKGGAPKEIEPELVRAASALDLTTLNALVAAHNRWYPIEANLPMDRKTGAYLVCGRAWKPEEPFTPSRLLAMASAVLRRE
jgi:hypothetical protein